MTSRHSKGQKFDPNRPLCLGEYFEYNMKQSTVDIKIINPFTLSVCDKPIFDGIRFRFNRIFLKGQPLTETIFTSRVKIIYERLRVVEKLSCFEITAAFFPHLQCA